jgi:hypothetical protein
MPPAPKFTKAEITNAALNIIRKNGAEALTAKELGLQLGSSARPIFTTFNCMEEVWSEALTAAKTYYNSFISKGFKQEGRRFFGAGMQLFLFAKEEPKLFALLFLRGGASSDISELVMFNHDNYGEILAYIEAKHMISREDSEQLFQAMFIFTYGIACLQATDVLQFTEKEVGKRIRALFFNVLQGIKGELNDADFT